MAGLGNKTYKRHNLGRGGRVTGACSFAELQSWRGGGAGPGTEGIWPCGVWGLLGSHLLDLLPPPYSMTLPDLVTGHHYRVADPLHLPTTTDTTPKPCTCPPVGGGSTEQPHTQSTTCPPAQQSHTPPFVAPLPCCPGAFTIQQKRLHQDKPGQRCIDTRCIHSKHQCHRGCQRLSDKLILPSASFTMRNLARRGGGHLLIQAALIRLLCRYPCPCTRRRKASRRYSPERWRCALLTSLASSPG